MDNVFRARYREGYGKKELMEESEVYRPELPPMITANTFKAGHRLPIEVSSSNFPRYGRNLNSGGNNYDKVEPLVARNRVHHGPELPSRIRVPVLLSRP